MPTIYTEEQRVRRRAHNRAWLAARPNYRNTLHSPEEHREINKRNNAKSAVRRREFYLRRRQTNQRDEVLAKERVYRATKVDYLRIYFRNYRAENRESLRAYLKRYRADNREHLRERHLVWYERNYDRIRKQIADWNNRWRKDNPAKAREKQHRHRVARRNAVVEDCSAKIEVLLRATHCHWCTTQLSDANRQIDHVVPISRGGLHCNDNLVAACAKCNRSKGAKLISEWMWKEAA